MQTKTRAKLLTAAAAIVTAAVLLTNQPQTNADILKADSTNNIVYIYTADDGYTVVGVKDTGKLSSAVQSRGDKKVRYEQTAEFLVKPPETYIQSTIIDNNKHKQFLPFMAVYKDIELNWPSDGSRTGYWRPAPGGVSIGHPEVTAGTLGGQICYNDNCNCFITNAHVAGGLNGAKVGDPIYQPGVRDGGTSSDVIGNIVVLVTPRKDVNNTVDAAIVCGSAETIYPEVYGIGKVSGVAEPYIEMQATKCGRTTSCTTLELIGMDVTVKVGYQIGRKWVYYTFAHQLLWDGVSAGGDSGSKIVANGQMAALLFAGNGSQVMSNDPDYILQAIPGASFPGMQMEAEAYP